MVDKPGFMTKFAIAQVMISLQYLLKETIEKASSVQLFNKVKPVWIHSKVSSKSGYLNLSYSEDIKIRPFS